MTNHFFSTITIFVADGQDDLVGLAIETSGAFVEIGDQAEYEGGYELDVSGTDAALGAFFLAYETLLNED